jgi:hypothetical protein
VNRSILKWKWSRLKPKNRLRDKLSLLTPIQTLRTCCQKKKWQPTDWNSSVLKNRIVRPKIISILWLH